ncbi:MAG: transglycosylase SLT domain-containing protein [Pyrinomonadaceae bacterium]
MKKALIVLAVLLAPLNIAFSQSDAALRELVQKDRSSRTADGRLVTLTASEHLSRGRIYFDNRLFPRAREHFQKILDNYPNDGSAPAALFMMGRSYYWERSYAQCVPYMDRVSREFPSTKDGREGLYFDASCNLRIGKNDDAARLWIQYTVMYPQGERVENAYVNAIDALRVAGRYKEADDWVDKTRSRFPRSATETNALHARLRMQIYREAWRDAEATAALMQAQARFAGSFTSLDEVKYLRGFALERQGKKTEAAAIYNAIARTPGSYWGWEAADRISGKTVQATVQVSSANTSDFPAAFRSEILTAAKPRHIDPRFVLALMKQESTFNPNAKSSSAARGLLQQTIDTALKYNVKAGYPHLKPEDLYDPKINIAIACENIADLQREFGTLYEAIAASYNGGDDNAARWLSHTKPQESGIFASEIGFAETKNYVFKVMTNYRIYKQLYDENLNRR